AATRRESRRRWDLNRAHSDPRALPALVRGTLRPHRRPGAQRPRPRIHAQGPHRDPRERTERNAHPPTRPHEWHSPGAIYAGSTPSPRHDFERHLGRWDTRGPCGFARPEPTSGGSWSPLVTMTQGSRSAATHTRP